jgi:murein L,D-transpeptidase YcbB/YkuD
VGKTTIAKMNVPVQEKIDKIRLSLERARWVLHELG